VDSVKGSLQILIVGIILGMAAGALLSYAVVSHSGTSEGIHTCPIVNHEILMKYLVRASPTIGGEATARAAESAYLEQHSPNYPLELFKEMYRNVPGRRRFVGFSYIFANDTLIYGRATFTNETSASSDFQFESPAPGMSQRIDGVGIIASRWAVIFVSLYDFGGQNDVEEFRITVPSDWRLEYYGGTGDIVGRNVIRVRFSTGKRNNYVVLAFAIPEGSADLSKPPKMEIKVAGDVYSLLSSST
jgi:hypothetical protein